MVTGEVKTGVWVVPVTTVIVAVSEQPFEFVKVMVVVPVVNPLTTPEFEIVATEVLEDTQAFELAGVEVADNVMDSPAPTDVEPEITGNAFTVTVIAERGPSQLVVSSF